MRQNSIYRESLKTKVRECGISVSQKAALVSVLDTVNLKEEMTVSLLREITGCEQKEAVSLITVLEELNIVFPILNGEAYQIKL